MSSVVITSHAQADFERLVGFLYDNGAIEQSKTLALFLLNKIDLLAMSPQMGRVYQFLPLDFAMFIDDEVRELVIPYGKNAYKILYFYQKSHEKVIVVSIKHSKEQYYSFFNIFSK